IDFDLPEVGIYCRVKGEIRSQVDLEISAGAIDHLVGRVIRIARTNALEFAAGGGIGNDLDLPRLRAELDSFKRSEISRTTVFIVPPKRPHVLLSAPVDFAPDLHPPHLVGRS